ncbi:MAG: amino acid ABC transporter permease, partial [Nocardioidaceae bacterium]
IVYTDLFRGIPTLIVAYLVVIGVPALNLRGLPNSFFWLAFVSLVLSYGAYVAEVIRSGMESVHPSQWASARALGLTHGQTVLHVVLPQAIRRVVPPLLNDFASLQKDTSLVGVVGVIESLRAANIYASFNFNYTPYVVASVLFIALTIPLARFTDVLIRRQQRREWAGAL